MKVEVIKCDGCGRILKSVKDAYRLVLETDKFWVIDGWEKNKIELDFCYACALDLKKTLEKIAERLEKKNA